MSSLLTGFAAITEQKTDLTDPKTSASVVAFLESIRNSEAYSDVTDIANLLAAHIADHKDPHRVSTYDFVDQFYSYLFKFYSEIEPTPLWTTLDQFRTNITADVFFELCRRLSLNTTLFDAVKTTTTPQLGPDWNRTDPDQITISTAVTGDTTSLSAFQKSVVSPEAAMSMDDPEWGGRFKKPVMYIGYDFFHPLLVSKDTGGYAALDTRMTSTDISVGCVVSHSAAITKTQSVVSLTNGTDTIALAIDPGDTVSFVLSYNGTELGRTPVGYGSCVVTITERATVTLETWVRGVSTMTSYTLQNPLGSPLSEITIDLPISHPDIPDPSLQSILWASPDRLNDDLDTSVFIAQ